MAGDVRKSFVLPCSCSSVLTLSDCRYGEDTELTEGYVKDIWDEAW